MKIHPLAPLLALSLLMLCRFPEAAVAQTPAILEKRDIAYMPGAQTDEYISERCRLDLYLPEKGPFPLLVWFHPGGLEGGARNEEGQKAIARRFAENGIGVALAGYRLSPKVQFPVYINDAAKAVKWIVDHAKELGSDPARVFVGGHSGGAYLAAILAMDPQYLQASGVDVNKIAGFVPMSGQMMTHFTIRKERGIADSMRLVAADEAAPIFHLRKETPPILLIVGDKDWPARVEENQFFAAAMQKVAKNENVSLLVVPDRDHGSIANKCMTPGDPAGKAMLDLIKPSPGG